ncbi:MAG: 4Fe-4S dicluster domain-containing protein [Alistipes sp.]|nr:4Fe-4S dicluster domain-containing protein [Alistipes sp.]
MKFYYINNSLCEDCDGCSLACPSAAVYAAGEKRYIIHDKCTSCGACIRSCAHNAVSIESIDAMVDRMENADIYLGRIRRLEQELAVVNNNLDNMEGDFLILLENHPSAIVISDADGNISLSNSRFNRISGNINSEMSPVWENLSLFLPAETASALGANCGTKNRGEFSVEVAGKNYALRGIPLADGRMLCVFDDLSDGYIAAARISEALERAVTSQVDMVRQIGTILGDGASSALNEINAALEIVGSSSPVKE